MPETVNPLACNFVFSLPAQPVIIVPFLISTLACSEVNAGLAGVTGVIGTMVFSAVLVTI